MAVIRAMIVAEEIRKLRRERDIYRAALKEMVDTQDEWEKAISKIIGRPPGVFTRAIDRARAALGE